MVWQTKRQRKMGKIKSKLKIGSVVVLIVLVVIGVGASKNDTGDDKTTADDVHLESPSYDDENLNDEPTEHHIYVSIKDSELKIGW